MAYRTVKESFWTDPKIHKLSVTEKLLYLYCITCPTSHSCGLYYLPITTIAEETGISIKDVIQGLANLESMLFLRYDKDTSTIFIRTMFGHQAVSGGNPKVILSGINKHLKNIHSLSLIDAFIKEYQYLNITLPERWLNVGSTLPQAVSLGLGLGLGLGLVTDTVDEKKLKSQKLHYFHEVFWPKYPKKKAKEDAIKAWLQIDYNPELYKTIMCAIEIQKTTEDWTKEKGKFIPYPASWLRGKRWEDDVKGVVCKTPEQRLQDMLALSENTKGE
jgi:hypothetical protein